GKPAGVGERARCQGPLARELPHLPGKPAGVVQHLICFCPRDLRREGAVIPGTHLTRAGPRPPTFWRTLMQRFLDWFRSAFRNHGNAARPRPVRLQFEQLEDRMTPSATSAITTSHGPAWFPWQTHDLYG